MNEFPLLSTLIALPALGAVCVALGFGRSEQAARAGAMGFALATLVLALVATARFDTAVGTMQFVERVTWIPALGVEWSLGMDGLGLVVVLLTGIVTPLAVAVPLTCGRADAPALRYYFAGLLLLESAALGVFLAQNFVPWFLFWELSLVPSFFLIRLWGGAGRASAAFQFFLYTLAGGIAMLVGFLALFLATGSFDFAELAGIGRSAGGVGEVLAAQFGSGGIRWSLLVFALVFAGLAVKVPVVPFHTWLPAAYAEAPTGATMMLTGLLSKMGVYGLLRILLPIFPAEMQTLATPLLVLAVATILLPALAALAQTDLKRILAYSSINHLGYCLLGIFAVAGAGGMDAAMRLSSEAALAGVILQIFNHGLTAAALFGFVAVLESRSSGLRGLGDFGGLRAVAPILCGLMGVSLFASLGLPGLNGFVGEFLVFRGVFGLVPWAAVIALPALLLTAIFLLRILARVFSGPLAEAWTGFADLSVRERMTFGPPVVLMLALGIFPAPLLGLFNTTLTRMLDLLP